MIALWSQEDNFEVARKHNAAFYQTWERFSRTPGTWEWWVAARLRTPPHFLDRFDALMNYEPEQQGGGHNDA